jgi:hypothetical protein
MQSLKSRIRKVETGLDVSRLSREQVQLLDVSRLSFAQVQSLDVSQLTDEQIVRLDFAHLTDAQLETVGRGFDEKFPEMAAIIHQMSDEELTAVKERRLDLWYPGCTGEWNE